MNVIGQDGSLINRETTPCRDLYPVVDQSFPCLRAKYSTAELGCENKVMSKIEACVRSCQNLGLCCSEPKYRRKRTFAVAVMLSLAGEVVLNSLDPDTPDTPRQITTRPERRIEFKLLAYRR